MEQVRPRLHWVGAVLFLLLAIASLAPIRSYDYFWHLAAGRWIVEHHALPSVDPFGVASSRAHWIDGEWLFQVLLQPLYDLGGNVAVSCALALGTSALFVWLLMLTAGDTGIGIALSMVILAWYGAEPWLRERPSTIGAVCLALMLFTLIRGERQLSPETERIGGASGWRMLALLFTITVVWINVHPSALIAPVVAGLFELGEAVQSKRWRNRLAPIIVTAGALLINPYGIGAVRAPLALSRVVAQFHNGEWQPSWPGEFPLLYVTILGAMAVFVFGQRRSLARGLVLLLLTTLALRYCRNQSLFFVTLPMLLGASIPKGRARLQQILGSASVISLCLLLLNAHLGVGVDARKFPTASVARLRASGLPGNIYNSYGIGGYLIWQFYPQRRVVTDGRNELYASYNAEHERAMRNGVAWRELIRRYDLRLAVFEYHGPPMPIADGRGRVQFVPAFAAYFPRRQWALIAIDSVAMVFARRDAFSSDQLARLEIYLPIGVAQSSRPKASENGQPPALK